MAESLEIKENSMEEIDRILDEVDQMMNNEDSSIRIKGGNVKKSFELLSGVADKINEMPDSSEKEQIIKRLGDLTEATKLRMQQWLLKKSLQVE